MRLISWEVYSSLCSIRPQNQAGWFCQNQAGWFCQNQAGWIYQNQAGWICQNQAGQAEIDAAADTHRTCRPAADSRSGLVVQSAAAKPLVN